MAFPFSRIGLDFLHCLVFLRFPSFRRLFFRREVWFVDVQAATAGYYLFHVEASRGVGGRSICREPRIIFGSLFRRSCELTKLAVNQTGIKAILSLWNFGHQRCFSSCGLTVHRAARIHPLQ